MSRYYRLFVVTTRITKEQLQEVCSKEFGWDGDTSSWKGKTTFDGEGSLFGGISEEEAHKQLYDALKKINPKSKVNTRWTYMEDLPYEDYGDDID